MHNIIDQREKSKRAAKIRVACFIDGFNLYHAIADLRQEHYKWLNLRKLMESYIDPTLHEIKAN